MYTSCPRSVSATHPARGQLAELDTAKAITHHQESSHSSELAFMKIPQNTPDMRPLSILLAEDSPLHRRHAVRLLESEGYRVIVVCNGREAFDALPSSHFDLVLMDVEMPELDGLTATRMIREREENGNPRVPIVAVTSTDSQEACLDAGMDAFLSKPLEVDSLKTTLEQLLVRTAAL